MGLKEASRGRWTDLLERLGVDPNYLSGRHGPCPMCGGKDRFRFTNHNGDGMWICNQCGTGDGVDLLQKIHGWGFRETKKAVADLLPSAQFRKPREENRARAREALDRVRRSVVHASEVPEVVRYLEGRGLIVPPGLGALPSMGYYEGGREVAKYPCMLGRVVTRSGKIATYHRTYLQNGSKAPVRDPKKTMKAARPMKGAAIRLWPAEDTVCIAEGIETAIACYLRWGYPAWSVLNCSLMEAFDPPEGIKNILIAGDNDETFAGQKFAYSAAFNLQRRGFVVAVRIPPQPGDWADEPKGGIRAAA